MPKPPLEKVIQRQVKGVYKAFGCIIYDFSQPRASMQTPGIPDLLILHLDSRTHWYMEVKRGKGAAYKQSQPQLDFDRDITWCGGRYVLGGVEEAYEALRTIAGVKIADRDIP